MIIQRDVPFGTTAFARREAGGRPHRGHPVALIGLVAVAAVSLAAASTFWDAAATWSPAPQPAAPAATVPPPALAASAGSDTGWLVDLLPASF